MQGKLDRVRRRYVARLERDHRGVDLLQRELAGGHAVAGPEAIVATSPFSRRAPASARRALEGMPLLIAGEDGEALNSINGRGYNIGKSEPSADLQKLVFEARRQAHARH